MCLTLLKIIFGVSAFLLAVLLILREKGYTKDFSPMKASDYISGLAGLMFFYVVSACLVAILIDGAIIKIVMLLFGLSPFIIGKLVTYEKVKIYSIIQIACIILSLICLVLI